MVTLVHNSEVVVAFEHDVGDVRCGIDVDHAVLARRKSTGSSQVSGIEFGGADEGLAEADG